jgi:hypothetical protein
MTSRSNLIIAVAVSGSMSAYSQDCNIAIKDASKLAIEVYSWTNPNLYDPKFQKLSDDKKDEQVMNYNLQVSSGQLTPFSTTTIKYNVKKEQPKDGADQYTLTTNVAGKDYSSYVFCKSDSIFFYRNLGSVEMPDGKGGSMGFMIQGVQILPLKMKVGDKLSTYDDLMVLYPSTFDQTLKRTLLETTGRTVYGDPLASSVQYKLKQIDVKVKETFNFSTHTVHYKNALVTAEEEVTVGGVQYKAYVISSETWTKPSMTVSYETADEAVKKSEKKTNEIIQESLTKTPRKQSTNTLGYTVSYLKEWFIPQIGAIARTELYDAMGGIISRVSLSALE